MGPAATGGTADQPHTCFLRPETMGSVARAADQASPPFAHRASEAFDERRLEGDTSCPEGQRHLRPFNGAMSLMTSTTWWFALFLMITPMTISGQPRTWQRPRLPARVTRLSQGPADAARKRRASIRENPQNAPWQIPGVDHPHELIGTLAIPLLAHDPHPSTQAWKP